MLSRPFWWSDTKAAGPGFQIPQRSMGLERGLREEGPAMPWVRPGCACCGFTQGLLGELSLAPLEAFKKVFPLA